MPPFSEVDRELQPVLLVGNLTFVDNTPVINLAGFYGINDFVKRHENRLKSAQRATVNAQRVKLKSEISGRQLSWNRYFLTTCTGQRATVNDRVFALCVARCALNEYGSIIIPHTRPGTHDGILIRQVSIRVARNGCDFE